jgi:hypothetical protein
MTNSKVESPIELNKIISINNNIGIHVLSSSVQASLHNKYIAMRVSVTVDPMHERIISFRLPIRSTNKPITKIPMTCIAAIVIAASFGGNEEPAIEKMVAVYCMITVFPENARRNTRKIPIAIPVFAFFVTEMYYSNF